MLLSQYVIPPPLKPVTSYIDAPNHGKRYDINLKNNFLPLLEQMLFLEAVGSVAKKWLKPKIKPQIQVKLVQIPETHLER